MSSSTAVFRLTFNKTYFYCRFFSMVGVSIVGITKCVLLLDILQCSAFGFEQL